MYYIMLIKTLLSLETEKCTDQRLNGRIAIKPSSIMLLLFAFFYATSPVDLLPEGVIYGWTAFIDDVIASAAAMCYLIADITSSIEGHKLGKATRTPDTTEPRNHD